MVDIEEVKEVIFTDRNRVIADVELDDGRFIEVAIDVHDITDPDKEIPVDFMDDKKMASLIAYILRFEIVPYIRS